MASRFVGDLHMSCGLFGVWGLQPDVDAGVILTFGLCICYMASPEIGVYSSTFDFRIMGPASGANPTLRTWLIVWPAPGAKPAVLPAYGAKPTVA